MVPITLVALRQAFGLDVPQLLWKIARIALSGAVMVCAVLAGSVRVACVYQTGHFAL